MTKSCASGTAKCFQILVARHQFPCRHQACVPLRFLFWSLALDGCHTLPPVFKPSCVLALTSMPWGSQELSKGWRSSWQCFGGFGGLRSAFGVPGLRRFVGQVCWAAGICCWMASARHWEHPRQRQGLINTLNHLCFDLSPDSQSDGESRELERRFVKAPLAKRGSPALRKGRSFRKESERSGLIQKDKQCMSVCILGFTYEIQSW